MDKLSKEQIQLRKANRMIDENMPEFARRFFNYRKPFRKNVFTTSKNIFITSDMTGNAATTLLRSYTPYLEYYEAEKGKDFDPSNLQGNPKC